jgi:hypothetical protein
MATRFLGREKGARDWLQRHPLIDPIFGSGQAFPPSRSLSASLAGRNLHLVVSMSPETQPLVLLYSIVRTPGFYPRERGTSSCETIPGGGTANAQAEMCISYRLALTQGQKPKKNPACAVYCGVLNLLSQVGPGPGTPPWLRPIALFRGMWSPFSECWLKT